MPDPASIVQADVPDPAGRLSRRYRVTGDRISLITIWQVNGQRLVNEQAVGTVAKRDVIMLTKQERPEARTVNETDRQQCLRLVPS